MIGKIQSIFQDFIDKSIVCVLTLKDASIEELQALSKFELTIDMRRFKQKRTLSANAYFHLLVGKIAKAVTPPISEQRAKNILICRYGVPDDLDGEPVYIKTNIDADRMLEQETLHCQHCGTKVENEKTLNFYRVFKGTHEYTTLEMSHLIDGTVEEARAMGIPTDTPQKIRELKERWGIEVNNTG